MSRFTRDPLMPIAQIIDKLHKKKEELKLHVDIKNKHSVDYKKHVILRKILKKFDALIDGYNKNDKKNLSKEEELKEINILLIELVLIIGTLKETEVNIILTPRDNKRRYFNYFVQFGTMGTSGAIGTAMAGPLFGIGMLFSSGVVSQIARTQTGMNNYTPSSGLLLNELLQNVMKVFKDNVDSLGDTCDFKPLTYEGYSWLDDDELDESKIKPQTIYLHAINGSVEFLYKDSKGTVKRHSLNGFLEEQELFLMQKHKVFTTPHKFAVIASITKSICSPDLIERDQNYIEIAHPI